MSESVAHDQIKAFVERILRLREEAAAIKGDIREVYAEAKGNGFDKTVLGKLVSYVEKRAAGAADLQEAEALFDLYLSAYDGATGTRVATHTHEADTSSQRQPRKSRPTVATEAGAAANVGGDHEYQGVAEIPIENVAGSNVAAALMIDETVERDGAPIEASVSAVEASAPHTASPSEIAEPGDRATGHMPTEPLNPVDAGPVVATNVLQLRTHNPETHFLNSEGLLRLHGCLKAEKCGSSEPRKRLCFDCSRLHDGPTTQDGAA